jgi:hypothetical protein
MGILANMVPSIEQLKPGMIEVIEESGSKQFFRTSPPLTLRFNAVGCLSSNGSTQSLFVASSVKEYNS